MENSGPSLKDYEDALRQSVDNLLLMYTHNGGNEYHHIVVQLLANISRLSPYLEEVLGAIRDEAYNRVAAPIEEAIHLGVTMNKKETKDGGL